MREKKAKRVHKFELLSSKLSPVWTVHATFVCDKGHALISYARLQDATIPHSCWNQSISYYWTTWSIWDIKLAGVNWFFVISECSKQIVRNFLRGIWYIWILNVSKYQMNKSPNSGMYFLFIHANKLIIHFLSVTGTIFWLNLKGFYFTMIKNKVPLQGYIYIYVYIYIQIYLYISIYIYEFQENHIKALKVSLA